MKKNFIILSTLLVSASFFSQVGVNNTSPQGTFHVDGARDNPATGAPTAAQQLNDAIVTSTGSLGLGTTAPTQKIDVAAGNVRVRDINTTVGVGGVDRAVVADANGVLKTIDFANYALFHARLAANINLPADTVVPLIFAAPIATSPFYGYNTTTGVVTFNSPGNYLVTMQGSFTNMPAGTQLVLGVRPFPDANYIGRASSYSSTQPGSSTIGQVMGYTTMIVVPSAGYQVRFTCAANQTSTVLSSETGSTGTGNVTNITLQKI